MNIQNNSRLNFTGAFRVRRPSEQATTELSTLIRNRGKQIFYNFENTSDIFLVVRDKYDRVVLKYLKEHNLPLEYYPKINTSSGLDSQEPEKLSELLKNKKFNSPLTSVNQIKKHINNTNRNEYIENQSPKYIDKILKSLCIDNKHEIKTVRGAKIIIDKEFDRKVFISPPTINNIHYVKVQPNSPNKNIDRYAIDSEGNILQSYRTPEAMMKFTERFNSLLLKE
ncbi:hypothetical protein IJ384_04940 [bacterium]|nr:hypothetical protein [bacterium]